MAATVLTVSQVQGGGGGGGVEIYPFSLVGRGGGATSSSANPSRQWITVQSFPGFTPISGSMNDSGVRVRQRGLSDLVTLDHYGKHSGQPSEFQDAWSLDLIMKGPVLRVWEGQGLLNMDGHYILIDAKSGDGEDLRLHNGVDSVSSRLLILFGERARNNDKLGIPESFGNVAQVFVLPVPSHAVSLEAARKSLASAFGGHGIDVALGLISVDGSGAVSQAWAAFRCDDSLAIYEIETR